MEELKEAAKNSKNSNIQDCLWTHPQQRQQQKLFRNTQSTTNHCKKIQQQKLFNTAHCNVCPSIKHGKNGGIKRCTWTQKDSKNC